MRVVIINQARMGSTRLPGKVLKEVLGKPLLEYQVERLRRARSASALVIATTANPADDVLVRQCERMGVPVFRGAEEDVLDRYYRAARMHHADVIARVTSDCPLIDPAVVDQVIGHHTDHAPQFDYVSNTQVRTYPRGMDIEVFGMAALGRAWREARSTNEREHVTPYLYRHPEFFRVAQVTRDDDQSAHRWTVDTADDFELIRRIIEALYPANPDFRLEDILKLLSAKPEWVAINAHRVQENSGR